MFKVKKVIVLSSGFKSFKKLLLKKKIRCTEEIKVFISTSLLIFLRLKTMHLAVYKFISFVKFFR